MKTFKIPDMFCRTPVVVIPKLNIKSGDEIIIKDDKLFKINMHSKIMPTLEAEVVEKVRSSPPNGIRKNTELQDLKNVKILNMFRREPIVAIPKLDIKSEDNIIIKDNKLIKINMFTNTLPTLEAEVVEKVMSSPPNGIRKNTELQEIKLTQVPNIYIAAPCQSTTKAGDQMIVKDNNIYRIKMPTVVVNKLPDEVLDKYSKCLSSPSFDLSRKNEEDPIRFCRIQINRIEDTIDFCAELGLKPTFRINCNNTEDSMDGNNNNENCKILKKKRGRPRLTSYK